MVWINPLKVILNINKEVIAMTAKLSEAVAIMQETKDLLIEASAEFSEKLDELAVVIGHIDAPPAEAMALLEEIRGMARGLADKVPD